MFCRGRSNILKEKTKVKSNEECAKLCKEEPSCNHWTRRKKDYLGRCWLKKTDSCTKENHKYDSGINCKGEVTLSLTQFAEGLNIFLAFQVGLIEIGKVTKFGGVWWQFLES